MTPLTFADLMGRNAFEIIGAIAGALKQLDRATGSHLAKPYREEAMAAGDYADLIRISHRYARDHLQSSLKVGPDPEEYVEMGIGPENLKVHRAKEALERAEAERREARHEA